MTHMYYDVKYAEMSIMSKICRTNKRVNKRTDRRTVQKHNAFANTVG